LSSKGIKHFRSTLIADTGEYIHSSVGRCNRESNCGHHYTPKQYFHDNNIPFNTLQPKAYKTLLDKIQPKLISFIPVEIFKSSLNPKAFENNYFVEFLINLFDVEITSQLVSRYFIATSKHWNGASVFWQIDLNGKVRTGKIILYDPTTGKRVKNQELPVFWVHKALMLSEFNLKQCLFGTHLLIDKTYPVAIVESEKTAIIASVYLPQFIWLATGGLNNLNAENCCYLKDRNVTLFPDLNGFEKWNNKAKTLSHIAKFTVSDLLERNATEEERKQGLDLADYLIRFNYKEFNIESTKPILDEEILIELQPNNENNIIQSHTSPAYLTDSGVLYIETPNWITYSFYPSIDHYNKRLCLPDFIDKTNIDITKFKVVQIDLKSLTINLN
jgi:hypothetical protein